MYCKILYIHFEAYVNLHRASHLILIISLMMIMMINIHYKNLVFIYMCVCVCVCVNICFLKFKNIQNIKIKLQYVNRFLQNAQ
jgi:uncharacterized protein (DUF983 family)